MIPDPFYSTLAGSELGLLEVAGGAGLAQFDVSLISQNLDNILSGRKKSASQVIGTAAAEGAVTAVVTATGRGIGGLAGDVGSNVSPGFGEVVNRTLNVGLAAQAAMVQGATQYASNGGSCR